MQTKLKTLIRMLEILVRGQVKGALHLCYFVFFLAKFAKVATEQIEVTKWEDTVSSPNFPQTYPTNSNISWIISVSSGNRIEIHIFSVQTQCDGDYLQIRDGKSMTSPLVGRYCGNNYGPFPVITSSGTYVLLQFVSDNTTDGNHLSGFTLLHTGLCHLHLNSTNGVITTPNHPNQYPNFLDCLWMIQLHPSVFINVECHDFALEQKEGCVFDYMEVLAGVSSDAPVIGRYCGIHNETLIFARQGNISIKFVSDKDKEFGGFRCTYKVGKVRGEWTNWTNWTECSRTCHHGNQTRYRACVNPLPESELQLVCDDVPDIERRDCFLSYCSVSTSYGSAFSNSFAAITYSKDWSIITSSKDSNIAYSISAEDSAIQRPQVLFSLDTPQTLNNSFSIHFADTSTTINGDSQDVNPKTSPLSQSSSFSYSLAVFSREIALMKATAHSHEITRKLIMSTTSSHLHVNASLIRQTVNQSQGAFPDQTNTSGSNTGLLIEPSASLTLITSLTKRMSFLSHINVSPTNASYINSDNTSTLNNMYREDSLNMGNNMITVALSGTTTSFDITLSKTALLSKGSKGKDDKTFASLLGTISQFPNGKISPNLPPGSTSRISEIGCFGYNTFQSPFSTGAHHENSAWNTYHSGTQFQDPASRSRSSVTVVLRSNKTRGNTEVPETPQERFSSQESPSTQRTLFMISLLKSLNTQQTNFSTTGNPRKLSLFVFNGDSLDTATPYLHQPTFRTSSVLQSDYSTSSMAKRTVSGERGLFTTTAPTLSSVTKHSSFRENHGTVKRTETRNDLNSIRETTGSRYHQITSTTNKHHYETIPLSSGITASYSFTGNNWKGTISAAVIIAVNTDDFETNDHTLSLLSGVNVSSSYATSAWKNTRATGILTSDKLNTSTPFSNSAMKSTPKTPFFALSTLTSSPVYSINSSLWHHSSDMYSSPFTASRTRMVSFDSTDSHQRHRASVTYHTHTPSSSTTVPPSPPPEGDTQSVLPFPWHLIPFMVIIFILIVIFIAHYQRIADIIDAIILILKDKKRKEKASKKEKRNVDMIKGNFSTAGFKASTFHSYQRELFYEDALNFSLFENTKAIEFSIQLDEEHQSSESRESVEIACVMGEESRDTKPLSDSLSEMFDPVETH